MLAPTDSSREVPAALRERLPVANRPTSSARSRTKLTVARIGYLAAATRFDGIVHSVFAHACNIACPSGLLTVAASDLSDGPRVWRIDGSGTTDFRSLLRVGDRLRCRPFAAFTPHAILDLASAATWRPPSLPTPSTERLGANVQCATAALERRRRICSSVIARDGAASLQSLEDACRRLDIERATAEIHRLVGWGEGLTPAGDDAIVGLLAALGSLACAEPERTAFLRSLSAAVIAGVARTTVISAHYLRLAADGHFNADVTDLARAFAGCGERDDGDRLRDRLEAILDGGATSGADMVAGMIAGFRAWAS